MFQKTGEKGPVIMSDHSQLQNDSCNDVAEANLLAEEYLKFQLLGEGNDNCVVSIIGTGLVIRIKKVDAKESYRLLDVTAQQGGSNDIRSNCFQTESSPPLQSSSRSFSCCESPVNNEILHKLWQDERDGVTNEKTSSASSHPSAFSCSVFEDETGHILWNELCASGCPKCSLIHQCRRDLAFLNYVAFPLFGPALVKPGRLVSLSPGTLKVIRRLLQRTREEGRLHKTINPYGIAILCPDASTLFHTCHESASLLSPSICGGSYSNKNQFFSNLRPREHEVSAMKTDTYDNNLKKSLHVLSSEGAELRSELFTRKKQRISRSVCKSDQRVAPPSGANHWKVSTCASDFSDGAAYQNNNWRPICDLKTSSLPNECSFMSLSELCEYATPCRKALKPVVSNAVSRSPSSYGGFSLNSVYLTKSAIKAKKKEEKLKVQSFLSQVTLDECCSKCGQKRMCKCLKKDGYSSVISISPPLSVDCLDGLPHKFQSNSKVLHNRSVRCDKSERHLNGVKDSRFGKNLPKDDQQLLHDHLSKTNSLFSNSHLKNSAIVKSGNATEILNTSHREPITLCVELKPKQGFLEPVKDQSMQLCRFCLKQFIKCSKGEGQVHSNYCPLDLFSGNISRMSAAVGQLFAAPQNNLKIFKDGAIVDTIAPYSYLSEVLPYVLLSKPCDTQTASSPVAFEDHHLGSKISAAAVSPASRSTLPAQSTDSPQSASSFLSPSIAKPQNDLFTATSCGHNCSIISGPSMGHTCSRSHTSCDFQRSFSSPPACISPTYPRSQSPTNAQPASAPIKPTLVAHSSCHGRESFTSLSNTTSLASERTQSSNGDANEIRNISFVSYEKILRDDSGNSSDSGTDNEFPFIERCENSVDGNVPAISSKLSSDSLLSSASDCSDSNGGVQFLNSDSSSEEASIEDVELRSSPVSPTLCYEPSMRPKESQGISTLIFTNSVCKNGSERVALPSQLKVDNDETRAGLDSDRLSACNVSANIINVDVKLQKRSFHASCQEKTMPALHSRSSLESNQCMNSCLPRGSILGKVYNSQLSQLGVKDAFEAFEKLVNFIGEDEAYKKLWVIPDSEGNDVCQLVNRSGCTSLQSCLEECIARTNCSDFDRSFYNSLRVNDCHKISSHVPQYSVNAARSLRKETVEGAFPCDTEIVSLPSNEHEKKQTHLKDRTLQNHYHHTLNNCLCKKAINSFHVNNGERSYACMADIETEMKECSNSHDSQITCLHPCHCRGFKSRPAYCVKDLRDLCVHCCKLTPCPSSPVAILPNLHCCDGVCLVNVGSSLEKSTLPKALMSSCELFCWSSNLNCNAESQVLTRNEHSIRETLSDKNCTEPIRRCLTSNFVKNRSSSKCSPELRHDSHSGNASLHTSIKESCNERDEEIGSLVTQIQEFLKGLTFKDCSLMILLSGPHRQATMDEALFRNLPRCFASSDHLAEAAERCGPSNPSRNTNLKSDCSSFLSSEFSASILRSSGFSKHEDRSFSSTTVPSSQPPLFKSPMLQSQLSDSLSVVSCPFTPSGCPFWVDTPAGWYLCQVTVIDLVSKDPLKVKHHFKAVHELTQLVLRRRQRGELLPPCCVLEKSTP
ncbi:Inositol-pentakisphosphate 2-kinase [Trinorchestia longiramus]|nr:Inositol-pentakisphosphate 2-kinase [Trinorchestia longiramus]